MTKKGTKAKNKSKKIFEVNQDHGVLCILLMKYLYNACEANL